MTTARARRRARRRARLEAQQVRLTAAQRLTVLVWLALAVAGVVLAVRAL